MLRSQHPRYRELLLASDGELDRRRQAVVDGHLSECVACRARMEKIRTTLEAAGASYNAAFGTITAEVDSRERFERALNLAAAEWNQSWLARVRRVVAVTPVRAGVAAAVGAALLLVVWASRPNTIGSGPGFHAPLPIAALTPGAVSSLTAADLCEGRRPSRVVTAAARQRVVREYRMDDVPTRAYELDALITPELGGTTEPENLWPQRYDSPVWNARVKDDLERLLPELVCSHKVDLAQAQQEIAADWIAAYKHYYRTDAPLGTRAGASAAEPMPDEDELELAPMRVVAERAAPALLPRTLRRP